MASSPHGRYVQGYVLQWVLQRKQDRRGANPKGIHSWDRSLQLDSVNVESLVIVDQLRHGESLRATARHTGLLYPKLVS